MENGKDEIKRKRPPFTIIENGIIEDKSLSIYGFAVYVVLCKFADQTGKAWPGYNTIARLAKCSRRKVVEAIGELIEAGYISKEIRLTEKREYTSNLYTILAQYEYKPKQQQASYPQGGAPHALPLVHSMHHPSAPRAPELYSMKIEPMKEKKGDKSPACPVSFDIKKKIEDIRLTRYSKANDLKRTYEKRGLEIMGLVERDKERFYSAYRYYILSTEKGLVERHHPLSLFLFQYNDTWRERVRPIREYIGQESKKERKQETLTDEERQEGAKILRRFIEGLKIGSA